MNIQSPFIGRMSRRNFILGQLLLIVVVLFPILLVFKGNFSLDNFLKNTDQLITVLLIIAPISLLFQFICAFRRLHDIGQSGLWALLLFSSLLFIPLVDMALLIYISYKKGDTQDNKYGTPDTRPLFKSILNI